MDNRSESAFPGSPRNFRNGKAIFKYGMYVHTFETYQNSWYTVAFAVASRRALYVPPTARAMALVGGAVGVVPAGAAVWAASLLIGA